MKTGPFELTLAATLAADDGVVSVRAQRDDVLWPEPRIGAAADRSRGNAPDLQHRGGFGLHLVELRCRRWGVHRDAGPRVWAELAFGLAEEPVRDRMPVHPDETEDTRPRSAAARAAPARAAEARRRGAGGRRAGDHGVRPACPSPRRRAAPEIAWSHQDAARTLRSGGQHPYAA